MSPATTVRHFLLPDGTPYFEDVSGGTAGDRSLVFLAGSLLAILDDSGSSRHVFSDHIGFPLAVVDDAGQVSWQAEAYPFGEIAQIVAGDSSGDPLLRYPGQWEVPGLAASGNTNLFYNTHRWYNPAWGRYTQPDPFGVTWEPEPLLVRVGVAVALRRSSRPALFRLGPREEVRPLRGVARLDRLVRALHQLASYGHCAAHSICRSWREDLLSLEAL